MTNVYEQQDFTNAVKQRKKVLGIYFAIIGVLLCACVAVLVIYTMQPYATPLKTPLILINSAISFAGVFFSFVYLGIKNKRTKAYYKLTKALQTGLKETTECIYYGVGGTDIKDGCEFNVLVFLSWFDKKKKYYKRNVLSDVEKPLPKFDKGDTVKFVTQGNVLLSYEITGHEEKEIVLEEENE